MIVFDTYAWIEYFAGSEKGLRVKAIIDSTEEIVTSAISLTEIKVKYEREKKESASRLSFVEERSRISVLDKKTALLAAEQKLKNDLPTVDAIIYATSLVNGCKVLTGDSHFKKLEHAELL